MSRVDRVTESVKQNMVLVKEVLNAYANKSITVEEKNDVLIAVIAQDMIKSQRILNVGFVQDRCPSCAGRGFKIIPELVQEVYYLDKCHGDPEKGILPCNGTHILTKVCERCHGLTLREVIEQNRDKLEVVPSDAFIAQHGNETFRLLEADEVDGKKYSYIPKKPCKACGGTGRFSYQNEKRTVPCTCVKKRLSPTGKIKTHVICSDCRGDGRILSNPVISSEVAAKLQGLIG